MRITTKRQNGVLVAKIIGELDHHSTQEAKRRIDYEMVLPGTLHLIFEFSELTFMDTSGIGMIVGRYKNILRLGGKAAVVGMNRQTKRVMDLTGFGKIIPFYDTMEEAFDRICG